MVDSTPHQIYEKVLSGDNITDEELASGIKFFGDLSHNLQQLGATFFLAHKEARRVYLVLDSYKTARILKINC